MWSSRILEDRTVTYACQYSIIRFEPFVETGEFANVGIALVCPATGYFGFEIAADGWQRMRRFFDPLEGQVYKNATVRLREELNRIELFASKGHLEWKSVWADLTRPRNGLLRFSPPRAVLAVDPTLTLAELDGRYLRRSFATREYQEQLVDRSVREVLNKTALGGHFTQKILGDDRFKVTLPFVQMDDDRVACVIKPLFLAHDDVKRIWSHGGLWFDRLTRLKRHNRLPKRVLIPVAAPTLDSLHWAAYREICDDLKNEGFKVSPIEDSAAIETFAQSARPAA
jgi:Protein of unknown function (DUF3037)